MRFSTELPPGVEPTFTPIVRLSPDGRQLFMTAMVNRREEVLRRPFDRLRMEVVAGAGQGDQGTGNSRPFVSPDGRWNFGTITFEYTPEQVAGEVPEPATALLLGGGAMLMGYAGRRRRARKAAAAA